MYYTQFKYYAKYFLLIYLYYIIISYILNLFVRQIIWKPYYLYLDYWTYWILVNLYSRAVVTHTHSIWLE